VKCTLARGLREELRKVWDLPTEEAFRNTGREWFLNLIGNISEDMRSKVIFLLWRVWHHRNNVVHGDGKATISSSVSYLSNYVAAFAVPKPVTGDRKGKMLAHPGRADVSANITSVSNWHPPMEGHYKVNVDAGWDHHSKEAGLGVVIRDHMGKAILAESKFVQHCTSSEEADVLACLEGLKHIIHR
jgi:hypothetical protein